MRLERGRLWESRAAAFHEQQGHVLLARGYRCRQGEHQGGGLGTAMVRTIVEHPDVADVRIQFLATRDAHGLYARYGFAKLATPQSVMEL